MRRRPVHSAVGPTAVRHGAWMKALRTGNPRLKLAAAEALAHCGDAGSLATIWDALSGPTDRFLEHALVHAAHRLARAEDLEAALERPEPKVQAAALLLLDQPPRPRGRLRAETVIARAASPDEGLRRAAAVRAGQASGMGGAAVGYIRGEIESVGAPRAGTNGGRRSDPRTARRSRNQGAPGRPRRYARSRRPTDGCWILRDDVADRTGERPGLVDASALRARSGASRPEVRRQAIRTAATLDARGLDEALRALADNPAEPAELRLEALRAVLPRHPEPSQAVFELLISRLGTKDEPAARLAAAELIGRTAPRRCPADAGLERGTRRRPDLARHAPRRFRAADPGRGGRAMWLAYLESCAPVRMATLGGGSEADSRRICPRLPGRIGETPCCGFEARAAADPRATLDDVRGTARWRRPDPRPGRLRRAEGRLRDVSSRRRRGRAASGPT